MAGEEADCGGDVAANVGSAITAGAKKRKSKSLAARGPGALNKKCGTGFEEYFADPPVTPLEYEEERKIYPPERAFEDRIEECLQRYRARRRLDNNRAKVFSRYLSLGGIDTTVRQFQGGMKLGKTDLEDDETVTDIQKNDVIHSTDPRFCNPDNAEHWVVDFTGVTKGFLSEHLPRLMGSDVATIQGGIDLVLNFLNYLITHDVCPEHNEDINEARKVCELARVELPDVIHLTAQLPGPFNTAACILYPSKDAPVSTYDNTAPETFDAAKARRVFLATVATNQKLTELMLNADTVECRATFEETYELRGIYCPQEQLEDFYRGVHRPDDTGKPGTTPCGYIMLAPAEVQDGWDNERPRAAESLDAEAFFVEIDIMKKMRVGMKMRLVVGVLSIGLRIIREVLEVYPSFYTFLPQELMLNYREPAPNYRDPPSVDCPNAEELALDKMLDQELE